MFAVTVDFTLDPAQRDAFMPLMLENAARSREDEPGCRQFDVCVDPARPERVFLYELYDDAAAFDAHLAAPHFRAFAAATASMITARVLARWQRAAP